MSIFREKTARSLLAAFLFIFLLSLFLELFIAWERNHSAWELLLEHNRAAASALLNQDVSAETIAKALSSTEISPEGIRLMNQLGIQEHTSARLFPALSAYGNHSFLISLLLPFFLFGLLLSVISRFLRCQERLFLAAAETVSDFTKGSSQVLLPQSEEGALYRLFASINHMAAGLRTGQEAEHASREFLKSTISDISHQLKTPLAALAMYNEIMLQEPDQAETIRTFAEKSSASIERMKSLILSLLKIARLDAGAIVFHKTLCPLARLLNASLEPLCLRVVSEKKELLLPQNQSAVLFCDPLWTCEALGNILKNALDHTSQGGHIEISVEQTPLETRIHVADDGDGIPSEDLHHIFKRFYRGSASRAKGAGLGLPLAKGILEGQEGNLFVKSSTGSGTVFTLCLPAPASLQNCKTEFTGL